MAALALRLACPEENAGGEAFPSLRHTCGKRSPRVLGSDARGGGIGPIQGLISGLDRMGTPETPRAAAASIIGDTFDPGTSTIASDVEATVISAEYNDSSPFLSDLQTRETSPVRQDDGLSHKLDAGVG